MSQKTYMYDTQWQALINAIDGGDTSAIATALGQIKTSIDTIETALGSLSADVTQDPTQFNELLAAIQSQRVTLDLSNINTDTTHNNSLFNDVNLTGVLNNIYNAIFNTDTNIIKWKNITTFSQFNVYIFKIGILKILWIDTAKNQINGGWQSGGVGNLPSGYESILYPAITVNKSLRDGTQMFIYVDATGTLNINPTAIIPSGYQIRQTYIYI